MIFKHDRDVFSTSFSLAKEFPQAKLSLLSPKSVGGTLANRPIGAINQLQPLYNNCYYQLKPKNAPIPHNKRKAYKCPPLLIREHCQLSSLYIAAQIFRQKRACPKEHPYAKMIVQLDITTMGQHRSLQQSGGAASKKRNVMKRFERVELLEKRGQWKDGQRVVGLRKTKPAE